jgi:integrase
MGLFKRGSVWWMSFVYQGKQYRKTTETEDPKLAKRIFDKVKGEIAEGKWFERLPGEERIVDEMMEKYMQEYSIPKKASSKRDQTSLLHLKPFFGKFLLSEVTPNLLNEYKVMRRLEGATPATINREMALMKHAFSLAVREWEWTRDNPVKKISMEKENNKRDRWLTDEEEKRLLQEASEWLREIVAFGLNTGMRLGEILSLTWKAVDLDRKTAIIFRSKNGERRTIPLNKRAWEVLKGRAKVKSRKTDIVFYNENHAEYDYSNLEKAFRSALAKAKIQDFRFHDLRHCFATKLVQRGVDLYKVQLLLGHKTPLMTQRYAHHYPESLREGVEALGRVDEKSITNLAQSPQAQ